jgi:metallo-beta-lactamase class B
VSPSKALQLCAHPLGGVSLRQLWGLLAAGCLVLSCVSGPPPVPHGAIALRSHVYVQAVVPGVWRHVSYHRFSGAGFIPSNGLIVKGEDGALIVDTAWNDEQTAALLDWVELNIGRINALVITHAHDDRLGGLAEAHRRGVSSYALAETVEQAAERGWPDIQNSVITGFPLRGLGVPGELFFPGSGHTADNATVWLRESRVLAGGCLVRATAATSMGNTSEADVENWPRAIIALQQRYPEVRIVVPGHGDPGGPELLAHTRELLEE